MGHAMQEERMDGRRVNADEMLLNRGKICDTARHSCSCEGIPDWARAVEKHGEVVVDSIANGARRWGGSAKLFERATWQLVEF